GRVLYAVQHRALFVFIQRGSLAGGAAHHQAFDAAAPQVRHQSFQRRDVDRAMALERGDQRNPQARKVRLSGPGGACRVCERHGDKSNLLKATVWKAAVKSADGLGRWEGRWGLLNTVPSLIRRRNRSSGQMSFGFLALTARSAAPRAPCGACWRVAAWRAVMAAILLH